jgi:hypothetical protein
MTDLSPDAAAWADCCRRLEALGRRLLDEDFPQDPRARSEGFQHLAQQVLCWLGWSVGHADVGAPAFQRQNDLITKWGGPNVDNVYRHARIDPTRRYRIRGRMNSCEQFILAIRAGFMHQPVWGTLVERTATDLGIHEGEEFELLVGGDTSEDGVIPLPPQALTVSIREYYFDWRPLEPATFTIECREAAPIDRPSPEAVARRISEASAAIEHSLEYWNRYLLEHRAAQALNTFGAPMKVAKGLDVARYGFCFYDLQPDEALYVETSVPHAPYWSFQLASMAWYESLDFANRIISLNHRQAVPSRDGRVRIVVSHRDPGVSNWLDTAGRNDGLLTFRWFWGDGTPEYTAHRVPLADLKDVLPADEPTVSTEQRAAVVAARRAHVAWRFRT